MQRPDIQILAATTADLPVIAQLAKTIWNACYPGIISAEQIEFMLSRMYSQETLQEEINSKGIRFVKLMVDAEPAGFASYGPTDEPGVCKLHKLYLKPDLQGKGLGSELLAHCETAARAAGAVRMILAVNKQNHRARRAYERNGYSITNPVVVHIGNGFVMDDFVMSKTLR